MSDALEGFRFKLGVPGVPPVQYHPTQFCKTQVAEMVRGRHLDPAVERAVLEYLERFPANTLRFVVPRLDQIVEQVSRKTGTQHEEDQHEAGEAGPENL